MGAVRKSAPAEFNPRPMRYDPLLSHIARRLRLPKCQSDSDGSSVGIETRRTGQWSRSTTPPVVNKASVASTLGRGLLIERFRQIEKFRDGVHSQNAATAESRVENIGLAGQRAGV